MTETPKAARVVRAAPGRRLIAAGLIRRFGGHTLTVRVTEAGVTGSITPATSGGPVCCGLPMRADGSQYVCDRCGSWTDPGITSRADRIGDIYGAAAEADHLTHCTHCREQDAEYDARHTAYGASTARRDRIQLGLHTTRTTAVTGR